MLSINPGDTPEELEATADKMDETQKRRGFVPTEQYLLTVWLLRRLAQLERRIKDLEMEGRP